MDNAIQPLPPELVYRMAAGEVIDSLAAVVRELIENALDAKATRISVSVWPDAGKVQVTDNGMGLSWHNLQQAVLPHTTSKITAFTDLNCLSTLGFRGEALHSIAQLGDLEIWSREPNALTGWHVAYDAQGNVTEAIEIAMAPGTTISVSQLFATWPSRQVPASQSHLSLRQIKTLMGDYALCHPTVTWQGWVNDRLWLSLAPGQSAQDSLLQLLEKLDPNDIRWLTADIEVPCLDAPLSAISGSSPQATLELMVGLPDRYHRQRPDWVRIAVNGRRVWADTAVPTDAWTIGPIEQQILNAFRQTLPRHRYPLCWVHLRIPAAYADWNRTAAKNHIYLHEADRWTEQIVANIRRALDLDWKVPENSEMAEELPSPRVRQLLKSAEPQGRYQLSQPINLSSSLPQAETLEQGPGTLRAIAQLHQTYIVAEHPSGLWLVEQHIAHERVLYEQLCQDWHLVPLTTPLTLQRLSDRQVFNLTQLGLLIEPFGHSLWAVRTAPQALVERADCLEALYELSHCTTLQPALVATACRSALRNGQPLSLTEMQTLLDRWQCTQHPRTCPHGRPIYLRLEEQALAKFFRRHWVIGKSHGL